MRWAARLRTRGRGGRGRTSRQILLFEHLTDGGAVVLNLTHTLLRLLELVVQILLKHTHRGQDDTHRKEVSATHTQRHTHL